MKPDQAIEQTGEQEGCPRRDLEETSEQGEKGSDQGEDHSDQGEKCQDLGQISAPEFFREIQARCHVSDIDWPETRSQGPTKLWSYGVELVALLLNLTPNDVRIYHMRGDFDLGDLESVCMEWLRRVKSRDYERQWPVTPENREARKLESLRRRAEKRRLKKLQWTDPDTGKSKGVMLPDPEDL